MTRISAALVAFARVLLHTDTVETLARIPGGEAAPPPARAVGVPMEQALSGWRDEMAARGCRPGSIDRMVSLIERIARSQAWRGVGSVCYTDAVAFLAARRRDDKPWSGPTYDQAVSTLRTFGEFCRRSAWVPENPLRDLQACGEPGEAGSRALTPDEAARLLAASRERHNRSKRAKGNAPLFWYFLFYTGLRYAEGCAARWKDVDLRTQGGHKADIADTAMLYTDPAWIGNKARRRDRVPLHASLCGLLREHARTVDSSPTSPIFPITPNRATWGRDREAAGIPARDGRGRPATVHSTRKSFATWLDAQSIPRGLVSRLARHAQNLTEAAYIDHDGAAEIAAIAALPPIWGTHEKRFVPISEKDSCNGGGACDTHPVKPSVTQMVHTLSQSHAASRPVIAIGVEGLTPERNAPGRDAARGCGKTSGIKRVSRAPRGGSNILIESGNGQSLTEKTSVSNALEEAVAALARYVNARLDSREEQADGQSESAA